MLSNFCPLDPLTSSFTVQRVDYDPESLAKLRDQYNENYSFTPLGDNLFGLWMSGDKADFGEEINVNVDEAPELFEASIKHLIFRAVFEKLKGRKLLGFYPMLVKSPSEKHDLIKPFLPDNLKGIVEYQKVTEITTANVVEGDRKQFGILVNISWKWFLNLSIQDLVADGYNIDGSPVLHGEPTPSSDAVLCPIERYIGKAKGIEGGHCLVENIDGVHHYRSNELFLKKTREEIRKFLSHKLGANQANSILSKIQEDGPISSNAKDLFNAISDIPNYFSQWKFEAKCGLKIQFRRDLKIKRKSLSINPTAFLFDPTPGSASQNLAWGLNQYGPYDKTRFQPKSPKILVVCQSANRASFSRLISALEKGLPNTQNFSAGLIQKFRLEKIHWNLVDYRSFEKGVIEKAIVSELEKDDGKPYDLIVMEGSESSKALPIEENPYFYIKAKLLSLGFPVQAVLPERGRVPDEQMQWVLGNLSLQIYAKIGGVPWTVQSNNESDHEIVVGIGHYIERATDTYGSKAKHFVGVTTFFTREGNFIMSSKSKSVPIEEYFEALLNDLETSIDTVSKSENWQDGSTVRIVFHVFKPMREKEADIIDALINRYNRFNVKYAFVTIAENHSFLIFDDDPGQNEHKKGFWIPERATNFVNNELECLLQLRGKKQIRFDRQGISRPAKIKIHPKSTYLDLHHIVEQILDFSHLSWRSLSPMGLPVTISYANLITEMMEKLNKVPGWQPEAINISMRKKKWFL